jgi:hypothetical protein
MITVEVGETIEKGATITVIDFDLENEDLIVHVYEEKVFVTQYNVKTKRTEVIEVSLYQLASLVKVLTSDENTHLL